MIIEFSRYVSQYIFVLKARNGKVMMCSKPYQSYLKCVLGWRTVQKSLHISDRDIQYRWHKNFDWPN